LPIAILGNPKCAQDILLALSKKTGQHRRVAIFTYADQQWPEAEHLSLVESAIEHAILAVPEKCDWEAQQLFEKAARKFKHFSIAPRYAADDEDAAPCLPPTDEGSESRLRRQLCTPKRFVDVSAAVLMGLLTLPLIALASLAVHFSSEGPVFYKQARIGRGNKVFTALKFRTMRANADEILNGYLRGDPALRVQWESVKKLKDDPRVTPVGRFLRRFSLDELPQLWNVLVGDMSLIGPRPIVIAEVERYGRHYAAYERVRPGLTGLWQVSGRNDTTYQQRVEYDSYYVRNWSPWLDTKIFLKTFRAVISGVGAY
jgi:Undecaprenyl-phosphate galactose phosphotransferase WbaP